MVKVTMQYTFGLHIDAPYRLGDMAQDALGILDALGIARAHVVGVSMGGMIAQILAADHADRLSSAAFVMTTTGSRLLPGPSVRARTALLSRPRSREFDDLVAHGMHVWRVIGSPGYPPDDAALRDRVGLAMRRSWHPQGMARQLVAISASQERSELVRRIGVPSLVIHGRADPLVPVGCGIDLAKRIPGAALELYDGMGHDLPAALVPRLAQSLLGHFARAA